MASALMIGGLAAAGVLWTGAGLLVNHTASLPLGLYRVTEGRRAASGALERGQLVVWCLPQALSDAARSRGHLARGQCPSGGEPILKYVAALPGDTVDVVVRGLAVNGWLVANSRPVPVDARGRPVTAVGRGRYVVPPASAWLWSPYSSRSFDSRYYGPLPVTGLVGAARPVWTSDRPVPVTSAGGLTPEALRAARRGHPPPLSP